MADLLPVDTTSPAIANLARPAMAETAEERAIRLEHLINPTAEDWARLDAEHVRAGKGMCAEYAHLLYDADALDATRPLTDLRKRIPARLSDGGQS